MQKKILKILIFSFTIIILASTFNLNQVRAVNLSTAKDNEKRILLEAAHGLGGRGCNHASYTYNNKEYFENYEARIMIDKIAGYLKQANIPYEISNELAGDAYFSNNWNSSCYPADTSCCGFVQGTIGSYSTRTYEHIDSVGPENYLFALELHFNGGDSNYSAVLLDELKEPYTSNGKKITDAVDSVLGTTDSMVAADFSMVGYELTAINNLYDERGIPVYYLETFFFQNQTQFAKYLNSKDELARAIAQVLVELAGSSVKLNASSDGSSGHQNSATGATRRVVDQKITGGSLTDSYPSYSPNIASEQGFSCAALFFMDAQTQELNNLGKIVQDIFSLMKWGGPLLAILLTLLDLIKLIGAGDLKSSLNKFIKRTILRVIIGIIIMLLPFILDFLFNAFGLYDLSSCNIQ